MTPMISREFTPEATPDVALAAVRWQAMTAKALGELDPFVIAVRTTGIFCRVGCPARTPHRHNVRFFDTVDQARDAGFRACKRCRPDAGDLRPWHSRRQPRAEIHA